MKLTSILLYGVLILIWLGAVFAADISNDNLRVYFLDVGQGDAILLRAPGGELVLIDGGGGDYILSELGEALPPWIRSIDVLVLTHPHADHLNGLLDVMERYEIREVWWNPVEYEVHEYFLFAKMLTELELDGVPVSSVSEGVVADFGGLRLEVAWPEKSWGGGVSTPAWQQGKSAANVWLQPFDGNINNDSVVIVARFGEFEVMLMGDAELEVEHELISVLRKMDLFDTDVLKAGHHCSRTASSEKLLGVLSPELAVCSCGEDNKFGHPHDEALERFEEAGVGWVRTDELGTILIESDGQDWWIRN